MGSGPHAGPRYGGEGPPPQPHEAVLPADGCDGVYHALDNRKGVKLDTHTHTHTRTHLKKATYLPGAGIDDRPRWTRLPGTEGGSSPISVDVLFYFSDTV